MPFIQKIPLSVRYMLLSALGFALMAACVKQVSNNGIPLLEIVAARALVSLALSFIDVQRKGISIWGNNKPWLIARGVVGAFTLIAVYYAVSALPLADATVIQYLHPVFTGLLAFIFLKEPLQRSTILCVMLSLTGLLIMTNPEILFSQHTSQLPAFAVAMAILGAFGSGVAYVIVRKLSQTDDASVIIFYFPLIALPIALIGLGDQWVLPTGHSWWLLLCIGIFTQLGQVGLTKAMQTEAAAKATAYSYIQVVFSAILGWLYFSELPSIWTIIGASLIIAGALINVFWKK